MQQEFSKKVLCFAAGNNLRKNLTQIIGNYTFYLIKARVQDQCQNVVFHKDIAYLIYCRAGKKK